MDFDFLEGYLVVRFGLLGVCVSYKYTPHPDIVSKLWNIREQFN